MSKAGRAEIKIQDLSGSGEPKKLAYTKTFTVEYVDPVTGDRLTGQFTVKRPTLGDIAQYGAIKARLNGGERFVEPAVDWINEMIAFCKVTLTEFPKWWDPTELYDDGLINEVYEHVRSFQDSFRGPSRGQQQPAPTVDSGAAA